MRTLYCLALITLIFLSGCTTPPKIDASLATQECIKLCENALKEGRDLSNGPCLSDNNPSWTVENWVCDVAHSPRQQIDNQRENQCNEWWESYQKGSPLNFVEVTPSCKFIKTG
ncbi:MAG: hypothetical protein QW818_01815 [Candidatus Aenigmatarchaeota archaeon]|nr:hypothetical protein [Candidatus Aenigmarchaeota archaeon]